MRTTWMFGFLACVFSVVVMGCAQTTKAPTDQGIPQDQYATSVTDQAAATRGTEITINIQNLAEPDKAGTIWSAVGSNGLLNDYSALAEADPTKTNAAFVQHGISVSITTGATTPSLAGTTTGAATQTAAQTSYPTLTPTQEIRPEFPITIPLGIAMPGGIADVAGSGAAGGSQVDLVKTSENLLRWAQLYGAQEEQMKAWAALLQDLLTGDEAPDPAAGDDTSGDGGGG